LPPDSVFHVTHPDWSRPLPGGFFWTESPAGRGAQCGLVRLMLIPDDLGAGGMPATEAWLTPRLSYNRPPPTSRAALSRPWLRQPRYV